MWPEYPGLSQAQLQLLDKGLNQLGLELSDAALASIKQHLALVQKWRTKINLISIAEPGELITHHALDSLALLKHVEHSQQLLDIGTGAGFPGVQLAAARPDMHVTLLDSRRRRIEFLRMVNAQIGLKNASFICARVEEASRVASKIPEKSTRPPHSDVQAPAKFDTLVARAVATLNQLVKLTTPLRYPGQRLVAMKGQYPSGELEALNRECAAQIDSVSVQALKVPGLNAERHAVTIKFV